MSTSTPSPMSDGSSSEGSALRAFVDEAIAKDRHAVSPRMSPRSALLSHTSLHHQGHGQPTAGPSSLVSPDAPSSHGHGHGVVDKRRDVRKKRNSGERKKRSTAMLAVPAEQISLTSISRLELDRLRKDPKAEALRLRGLLEAAVRKAHAESKRAADLERANEEAAMKFRVLNDNRVAAQQEAAKANSELRVYQYELDNAQKEIDRAKGALVEIEKQRDEAEAAAKRAREKARKMHQERMIAAAREEGRKLGYEAGFDHAKKEKEILAARRPPLAIGAPPVQARTSSKGKERAYPPGPEPVHPRRSSRAQRHSEDDIISSPEDLEMSPSQLPILNLPELPLEPPTNRPAPSNSTPLQPFRPPTEIIEDEESESDREPTPPPRQPSRNHERYARSKTPSIQVWPLNIPTQEQLDRSFNSHDNPNDAVPQPPRESWVTATKHREIRGPPRVPPVVAARASIREEHPPSQEQEQEQERPPQMMFPNPNTVIFPAGQPPPLLPPYGMGMRPPQFYPERPAPHGKSVKFPMPKLSRPSLAKTKQQAASWYRTLSFRKKNKPVIDPIPEEPSGHTPTGFPSAALPTSSTDRTGEPQTGSMTHLPDTAGSRSSSRQDMYGRPQQPPASWYQGKQPSIPNSVRSQDYAYATTNPYGRRRPISDAGSVSTRVSQFDLLATPNLALTMAGGGSGPGGGGKGVREKDSFLSVIKEDPASRGNTPDRYAGGGAGPSRNMAPRTSMGSMQQPNFGQNQQHHGHGLQQQSSYGTFDGSVQSKQNKRQSRRPGEIVVPDPDAPLDPAGVPYARHSQLGVNGYRRYPSDSNPNLARRPSRISERTTDTSIGIDIVPPSGFAPDPAQSPPHTGRNHLSPYHVFRPSQSFQSLHSQGAQPPGRPDSAAADRASRQRSNQTLNNTYADPSAAPRTHTSSRSRADSTARPSNASGPYMHGPQMGMSSTSVVNTRPGPSQTYSPLQPPNRPFAPERPESLRSYSSNTDTNRTGKKKKKRPVQPHGSQTSFVVYNPDPPSHDQSPPQSRPQAQPQQYRPPSAAGGSSKGKAYARNDSGLVLVPPSPIHRMASSTSMRSNNSYSKYDPDGYVDPAFWGPDGPDGQPPPPSPNGRMRDRRGSVNSGLSYA